MSGRVFLSAAILALSACATPTATTTRVASTSYRPIEVTPAMKAGITATRPFELIYALAYATARTDKAVPETFGGLSSLLFSDQKGSNLQFEVITDQGYFGTLTAPDAMLASPQLATKLSGNSTLIMLPLRSADGAVFSGAANVDSEGLTATKEGRLISLERNHRIVRLSDRAAATGQATTTAGPALTGFDGLEPNGGMEALVALPDGRFLASAEFGRMDQGSDAKLKPPYWIFGLNQEGPIAPAGSFTNTGGFGVTEARVMDNDLWLLKREYDFTTKINKARLERCPLAGVLAGAPVCTLELAIEPPFVMDNYEGLEIFKQAGTSDLYIYILSDDNFSDQQRTVMLAFKVPG